MLLCLVLSLAGVYTLKAQCPASTPLVMNSVTTTESRCQASGTATVSASGGSTPYTYSIIAGPTLSAPQSSNILQSLAPGTYTVQVTDNCNTSVTSSFTVTGTYAVPSVAISTQMPSCPSSSDGSITINITNGRAPLAFSLVSPSPVTAGPQTGNVFTGLPVGTYTCQVTDSCGNFQTRTVVLTSASAVNFYNANFWYISCDSFAYAVTLNVASSFKPPYTLTLPLPGGQVLTHVLTNPTVVGAGYIMDTFYFRYHHINGDNEVLTITAADGCGSSNTTAYFMENLNMRPTPTLATTCGTQYTYTFDYDYDNALQPSTLHCGTITYTLVSPSGTVLASQLNNSTFSGYPPGTGYQVIRQDCCERDTLLFDWDTVPAFTITNAFVYKYATCKEGTSAVELEFYPTNRTGDIVFASGPPTMTLADGTTQTLTYPDTIHNILLGTLVYVNYFTVGTYKLYVNTACGETDSVTVTVDSSDLRHSTFSAPLIKGCAGANKIMLNAASNTVLNAAHQYGHITVNTSYDTYFANSPFTDSIVNVPSGTTWYASFHYLNPFQPIVYPNDMATWGCDAINDTIVVPSYTQPEFNASAAVAICGATRQVALLPDSSTGVTPYEFQIVSGPTTTALQTSPVFSGISAGTYTFQMVDACDNSFSRSITIDTLTAPTVVATGSTCVGSDMTLTLPASPFYSYSWQLPDGSTSTSNTLALHPVTASDIGTYTISVTSAIGGCTNITTEWFSLNSCLPLLETLLGFSGEWNQDNINLYWQTTDELNLSYYIVERSTDGYTYTPVQRVTAGDGLLNNYTATDTHVPEGTVYYRLQMVKFNGQVDYSGIISFSKAQTQSYNVHPTLVTGDVPVTVTCPRTINNTFIRVIGVDGKVWLTGSIPAGSTAGSIDVSSLAKGMYFVVLINDGRTVAAKILKQ
ncbi:putative secreted protein (Por secretion system target) [Dinghuibacter silviterrae]|uniref:Putative secreted protein (Por secretion system target) n=1 Tax=Dinghuibacter silviterrae TaxID=1539049 RepID=A0A4V3GKW4_9BACT|nr:putative secreted protein (Por secretion system target) [Dinghuibacter silviterrae]